MTRSREGAVADAAPMRYRADLAVGARSAPLLPEVGLLAMPYHNFSASWMTPHHVLTRLASYFHVTWLEPPHHWREALDLDKRRAAIGALARNLPESFQVYVPEAWLPDIYRWPWLRNLLLSARVRRGWQTLKRRGCRSFVLYLWHPQFEGAIGVHRQNLSLYHIEDEYSFLAEPPPMDERELRVIRGVDQVFVHSPQLLERKGWINPHTTYVPNGVDYALYSEVAAEPADIARIPHPRIGYTGNLKTQLDWRLLSQLAADHPNWSFVFVGPRLFLTAEDRAIINEMQRLKNVHLLGQKTVKQLAAYPQHFDVCVMPYIVNGYTQNIYPMKLHEYLASGRPVISTPIRSVEEFDRVVRLARTAEEWSAAVEEALAPQARAVEAVAARQAVAQRHDWSELTYRIARVICERFSPEDAARIEKVTVTTPHFESAAEGRP